MEENYSHEASPPTEEDARIERFVEEAHEATEPAYQMLRGAAGRLEPLASAVAERAADLYLMGHGAQAEALVDRLAELLRPADCADPACFTKGMRLGFAAGCLVQWRVLGYLVGQEMPLWPVQSYATERQID